jgi:hypothetical protein
MDKSIKENYTTFLRGRNNTVHRNGKGISTEHTVLVY